MTRRGGTSIALSERSAGIPRFFEQKLTKEKKKKRKGICMGPIYFIMSGAYVAWLGLTLPAACFTLFVPFVSLCRPRSSPSHGFVEPLLRSESPLPVVSCRSRNIGALAVAARQQVSGQVEDLVFLQRVQEPDGHHRHRRALDFLDLAARAR